MVMKAEGRGGKEREKGSLGASRWGPRRRRRRRVGMRRRKEGRRVRRIRLRALLRV